MSLRMVSVNVERSKHLGRVLPFLREVQADIVCVQELCERDIPQFEKVLGLSCTYAPVGPHPADAPETEPVMTGVGVFAQDARVRIEYYKGSEENAMSGPARSKATDAPLITADVRKGEDGFRILTTHFTWTPDGKPSDEQRTDVGALLELLGMKGGFVLCGDFNAPRGGEIFSRLAMLYQDAIPPEYATSIDVSLHKVGTINPQEMADKMVDGLFLSSGYEASDVRLQFGVSDHAAIVATIRKA